MGGEREEGGNDNIQAEGRVDGTGGRGKETKEEEEYYKGKGQREGGMREGSTVEQWDTV